MSFWHSDNEESTPKSDLTTTSFWHDADPAPEEQAPPENFWKTDPQVISGNPPSWDGVAFWRGETPPETGNGMDLVVVGRTRDGQYVQSDLENPVGTASDLSAWIDVQDINCRDSSTLKVVEGDDAPVNRLFAYGDADFTEYQLEYIDWILPVGGHVTFTAQQLQDLDFSVLFGSGPGSGLHIENGAEDPVELDLSGKIFSGFQTLHIAEGVTLVADQEALEDVDYITGQGTLKAAGPDLDLEGIHLDVEVQDALGVVVDDHGGTVPEGELLVAGSVGQELEGSDENDRIIGGDGDDILYGNNGNDILRGGAGVDEMYGGEGDDKFVVVGDLTSGGKEDSAEDTFVLGEPLSGLDGKDLNEDADGGPGIIDGGQGDDTLYVYGKADFTNYTFRNVQNLEIRSDVSMTPDQFDMFENINGDGRSVIRIENTGSEPVTVNLADAFSEDKLQDIGMIEIGDNVTLEVSSADVFGGARVLVGNGTVKGGENFSLPETFAIESSLTVQDENGDDATGNADVLDRVVSGEYGDPIYDTDGNDYLVGTDRSDTFVLSRGGNDVVSARDGDDTFKISGPGKKVLLSTDGIETVDLSDAPAGADIDLTYGGTLGQDLTEIRFGTGGGASGVYQEAPESNVMLIIDVSGSMRGGNLRDVKQAAQDLFDAYENVGQTAVRIVTFSSSAHSSFNGNDAWMDVDAARSVIDSLSARGGTNFRAAINKAMSAFEKGKGETYLENGANASYFLSDGQPNWGRGVNSSQQDSWEEFAVNNQLVSHAIGFDGLNHVGPLKPIAFDGTQLTDPSQDRTPGQIDPLIEYDSSTLADTVVEQANLDYIENLTGTAHDDVLVGNSLNNVLEGLGGNDKLVGKDNVDTAEYQGNRDDYNEREWGQVGFDNLAAFG
jgi:uncharacterized protein YegL